MSIRHDADKSAARSGVILKRPKEMAVIVG
jgi:hypothetical protein